MNLAWALKTQMWNCISCQIQQFHHVDLVWAWNGFVLGCLPHLTPPSSQLAALACPGWRCPTQLDQQEGTESGARQTAKPISTFSSMGSRDVRGGAARFSTGWDITRPTKRQLKQRKHKHKYTYKAMRKAWHGFWTCWHFRHLMTWIIVTWPFRATLGGIQIIAMFSPWPCS